MILEAIIFAFTVIWAIWTIIIFIGMLLGSWQSAIITFFNLVIFYLLLKL